MRLLYVFAVLLALFIGHGDGDLQDQIYAKLKAAAPCNRLLHRTGQVGCSTPPAGLAGTLRYLTSEEDVKTMIKEAPSDPVSLLIPQSLCNKATFSSLLESTVEVAGVMVASGDKPVKGFSSDAPFPQKYLDIHHSDPSSTSPYVWNPAALQADSDTSTNNKGIFMDDFPFAIIALSEKETALITERGRWNQDRLDASEFPAHAVKFKYHMYGEENSIECLKSKKCLPLGGYSTWSVLGRQLNESTPFVFAVAGADSSSFFHDFVAGADADVSGVVSLLAAASALSKVADVTSLPKQIAFALFEGESWGYLGSRRFVHDIAWFQCDEYRTKEGVKMCQRPYRPSLEFTKIKLDNIDRIIEVNQIGLNNTLFMHREHDSNPATDALISDIRSAAGGIESDTLKVEAAAQDTPGVPPSSVQAFLSLDRSKPVVVLTDHKGPYTNKYYHSRFDDYQYVESDEARVLTSRLCSAATLLARSLYKSAGGSDANAKDINADCSQTISLFRCLSRNVACDLVRWYSSIRPDRSDSAAGEEPGEQEEEVPANHYTSVYQIKLRTYISGLPRFYMNWLTEVNLNATKAANAHNLHELELELEKGSAGSSPSLPSVRAQLDRNAEVEDRDFAAKMVTGVNTDYDYDVTDESDYSDDDFMLGMEQKNRLKEERLQRIELQELKEEEELCTFFHDAVDPALIYDYEHSNWKINESIPESMIWTESNWGRDLGTLSYRRESGMMESVMLAAGIIVLTAGLVLLPLSRYFCKRKFKLL